MSATARNITAPASPSPGGGHTARSQAHSAAGYLRFPGCGTCQRIAWTEKHQALPGGHAREECPLCTAYVPEDAWKKRLTPQEKLFLLLAEESGRCDVHEGEAAFAQARRLEAKGLVTCTPFTAFSPRTGRTVHGITAVITGRGRQRAARISGTARDAHEGCCAYERKIQQENTVKKAPAESEAVAQATGLRSEQEISAVLAVLHEEGAPALPAPGTQQFARRARQAQMEARLLRLGEAAKAAASPQEWARSLGDDEVTLLASVCLEGPGTSAPLFLGRAAAYAVLCEAAARSIA